MTYVPVADHERKGHGRTPLDIPEGLLAQLRHSRDTGAECVIQLDGTEDPKEIADLRRALVRAQYRYFGEHTVHKRFTPELIKYWVTKKEPRGKK